SLFVPNYHSGLLSVTSFVRHPADLHILVRSVDCEVRQEDTPKNPVFLAHCQVIVFFPIGFGAVVRAGSPDPPVPCDRWSPMVSDRWRVTWGPTVGRTAIVR